MAGQEQSGKSLSPQLQATVWAEKNTDINQQEGVALQLKHRPFTPLQTHNTNTCSMGSNNTSVAAVDQ